MQILLEALPVVVIGYSVLTDEDKQSLQEGLHKISVWLNRWKMPFNIDKCQLLQAGRRNKKFDNTLRTRNNGIKLKCRQVNSDCTNFFFTNVVVRERNKLPPSVVQCNTIDSFKNKLDRHFLQLTINES